MSPTEGWSAWQTLPLRMSAATLAETLDGGQAFRWCQESDRVWCGVWANCVARLRLDSDNTLAWSAPRPLARRMPAALTAYLALDTDFPALKNNLPWRSDAHLATCIAAFPGLRLLRQPFGETLLGFLCSATKQIVQIKQMVALLAQNHGAEIIPGIHALPTWPELAAIPETDLRDCLLGFRARHIAATARFLAERPGWLEATATLPYAAAHSRLLELPGVGAKIADCVLLFGAGRLEAFPVDTWILKILQRHYGLNGWTARQIAHFGRVHFGPGAGLAQQYLFAHERAQARTG